MPSSDTISACGWLRSASSKNSPRLTRGCSTSCHFRPQTRWTWMWLTSRAVVVCPSSVCAHVNSLLQCNICYSQESWHVVSLVLFCRKQTQPGNISTLEASLYCLWELDAISPFTLRRCLKCFKIFVDTIVEQSCRLFISPTYGTRHIFRRHSGALSALPTFLIAHVVQTYLLPSERVRVFKYLSSRLNMEFDTYIKTDFGKCTIFD